MTITQYHVPIDDENCYWYSIFTSFTTPVDKKKMREQRLEIYELPDYKSRRNKSNDYGFDPHEQATATYTGMGMDINVHDQWAVESMGAIQDRTREHLGQADKAIVQYRRLLRDQIEKVAGRREADHVPRRGACAQHPGAGDHGRHRADPRLGDLLDGSRREAPPRRALGRAGAERDRREGAASVGGGVMLLAVNQLVGWAKGAARQSITRIQLCVWMGCASFCPPIRCICTATKGVTG